MEGRREAVAGPPRGAVAGTRGPGPEWWHPPLYDHTVFPGSKRRPPTSTWGAIHGFRSFDRNGGQHTDRVRVVVEGVRIDVSTARRTTSSADIRTGRMRGVIGELTNEIARRIRAPLAG